MATIKFRRDTASRWTAANPVLSSGEPGYEKDTKKFKIGDGSARWNDLEYFVPESWISSEDQESLLAHINSLSPHPVYDDGPSLDLLYQNAKV